MPKKEADFNVFLGNIRNAKPADMPKIQDDPRDNYPQFKAKGGEVKKAGRLAMRGYGAARK